MLVALLAATVSACATDADPDAREKSVHPVLPIARVVLPRDRSPDWQAFREDIRERRVVYDEVFRKPVVDPEPLRIACRDVRGLGIVLAANLPAGRLVSKKNPLRFTWKHESIDLTDRRFDRFRAEQMRARDIGDIYFNVVELDDSSYYVDGEYTVDVRYLGELLYSTTFFLVDCASRNRPEWWSEESESASETTGH